MYIHSVYKCPLPVQKKIFAKPKNLSSKNRKSYEDQHIITLVLGFNTYNAAGVSRRQDQNVTNCVKNVNILEFGYYIWNPYTKCIQKSPNMFGIGSLICEIAIEIWEIWESKQTFAQ